MCCLLLEDGNRTFTKLALRHSYGIQRIRKPESALALKALLQTEDGMAHWGQDGLGNQEGIVTWMALSRRSFETLSLNRSGDTSMK